MIFDKLQTRKTICWEVNERKMEQNLSVIFFYLLMIMLKRQRKKMKNAIGSHAIRGMDLGQAVDIIPSLKMFLSVCTIWLPIFFLFFHE
jgi:hypothetical protein